MTERCEEFRAELIPFVRRELSRLQMQRVQAHIGHCSECGPQVTTLRGSLEAAQQWQPDVDPTHLATLNDRLRPYMHAQPPSRALRFSVAALALSAAALAIVVFAVVLREPTAPAAAVLAVAPAPAMEVPAPVAEISTKAERPTPHLWLVRGEQWDGVTEGSGRQTQVRMTRGFAAFSFAGGNGRTLNIEAPGATVEVVGTRFYVGVDEATGVTTVAVREGRVRVRHGSDAWELGAGRALAVDADGVIATSINETVAAVLDDPFLMEASTHKKLRRRARRTTPPAQLDPARILDELARAETLALDGRVRDAVAAYQAIADAPEAAYDPYRPMARYEQARLWGSRLGEPKRARRMLEALAADGSGEVSRQARLAICELTLQSDRCATARCLQATARGDLEAEALRLISRWGLNGENCAN